jgi:hypothetical protein
MTDKNSPENRAKRLQDLEFKRKRKAILARIAKLREIRKERGATHWEQVTSVEKQVLAQEQLQELYYQYGRAPLDAPRVDRRYYDEWRLRLLQIDHDLYHADAPIPSVPSKASHLGKNSRPLDQSLRSHAVHEFLDKIERQNWKGLSPQKRKRLDALRLSWTPGAAPDNKPSTF